MVLVAQSDPFCKYANIIAHRRPLPNSSETYSANRLANKQHCVSVRTQIKKKPDIMPGLG